jgi:hypothetical protein
MFGFFVEKWMLDVHAEHHDTGIIGQMVVDALGIKGTCEMFCKSKNQDCYNVGWTTSFGETYAETIPYERIINAIRKLNYKEVTR